jgi:hypothetical protein
MRNILLIALFVFSVVLISSAQDNSKNKEQEKGPVAVPTMSEKAVRYYKSGVVLWVVDTALGFLIQRHFYLPVFLHESGIGPKVSAVNGFSSLQFIL